MVGTAQADQARAQVEGARDFGRLEATLAAPSPDEAAGTRDRLALI